MTTSRWLNEEKLPKKIALIMWWIYNMNLREKGKLAFKIGMRKIPLMPTIA